MDYETILLKYGIPYSTSDDSRNVAPGWVGVQCPFCDDPSDHMGLNLSTGAASCWRCGNHLTYLTLSHLLNISYKEAKALLDKYKHTKKLISPRKSKKEAGEPPVVKYPTGTDELQQHHKQYLARRGYNPEYLRIKWLLQGTPPASSLAGDSYKNRILAPIHWSGELVSFQTRSVSDKVSVPYKACPKTHERIHHKDILYTCPTSVFTDIGIIVEGICDAWRIGERAAATFGIGFTHKQVLAIARSYKYIAILYDNEKQAIEQAELLQSKLRVLGKQAWVFSNNLPNDRDPDELSSSDARELVNFIVDMINRSAK